MTNSTTEGLDAGQFEDLSLITGLAFSFQDGRDFRRRAGGHSKFLLRTNIFN